MVQQYDIRNLCLILSEVVVKFNYIKSHKEKGVTGFNAARHLFKHTGTWARAMGYAGFDTRVFFFHFSKHKVKT